MGFPSYELNRYDKKKELDKLITFDEQTINKDNMLKQTMHGCGFLWTYFPHWAEVCCGNDTRSVLDYWNDDKKLKDVIRKTWRWQIKYGSGKFTLNRLRQNCKVYGSKQSVSNFRPSVAKYIYNTYCKNGVTWDMCSGWGGRLFGFLSSNADTYIGTEVSTKTYIGLKQIKKDFEYVGKNIEIYNVGSEIMRIDKDSVDLCFTSPPYFDTEKYANEPTQSYVKYPTKEEWVDGFLFKTLSNAHNCLKDDGVAIINIANTPRYNDLEESTLKLAKSIGFKYSNTLQLTLSSIAGKGVKTEPMFVLKK